MMKLKQIIGMFLCLTLSITYLGCKQESVTKKSDGNINILVESQNTSDKEAVELLLNGFKEKYDNYTINVKEYKDINEVKKNISEKEYDIVICNRPSFLELHKFGLINELTSYFENSKLQNNFYNIISSYGKIGEKFYGMALFPYSLEFIYNHNALNNFVGNRDVNNFEDLINFIKENNIKIPVILPKELNLELALSTLVTNSIIKEENLIHIYDGEKETNSNKVIVGEMLNTLNKVKKEGRFNYDYFYTANINDLTKAKTPIALVTSLIGIDNRHFNDFSFVREINKELSKTTPPVFSNYIVCSVKNSKNSILVNKFLDYALSNDSYVEIGKKGYFTGNKYVDSNCLGINKKSAWTIANAGITNIPYYLNFSNEYKESLIELIKKIMNENYDVSEIKSSISNIFK